MGMTSSSVWWICGMHGRALKVPLCSIIIIIIYVFFWRPAVAAQITLSFRSWHVSMKIVVFTLWSTLKGSACTDCWVLFLTDLIRWLFLFDQYKDFMLLLLDLVRWLLKQSAAQLSVPASDGANIIESVSTNLTSTVSPPSVWLCYHVTFESTFHMLYVVSGTQDLSHSFLGLPFSWYCLHTPHCSFLMVVLSQEMGLCSSEQCINTDSPQCWLSARSWEADFPFPGITVKMYGMW